MTVLRFSVCGLEVCALIAFGICRICFVVFLKLSSDILNLLGLYKTSCRYIQDTFPPSSVFNKVFISVHLAMRKTKKTTVTDIRAKNLS